MRIKNYGRSVHVSEEKCDNNEVKKKDNLHAENSEFKRVGELF